MSLALLIEAHNHYHAFLYRQSVTLRFCRLVLHVINRVRRDLAGAV